MQHVKICFKEFKSLNLIYLENRDVIVSKFVFCEIFSIFLKDLKQKEVINSARMYVKFSETLSFCICWLYQFINKRATFHKCMYVCMCVLPNLKNTIFRTRKIFFRVVLSINQLREQWEFQKISTVFFWDREIHKKKRLQVFV